MFFVQNSKSHVSDPKYVRHSIPTCSTTDEGDSRLIRSSMTFTSRYPDDFIYKLVQEDCPDSVRDFLDVCTPQEVQALLSYSDEYGCSPLFLTSQYGRSSIVEILVKAGADLEAVDHHGGTSLLVACESGHPSVVEILLKAGANIEAVDPAGNTPLSIASAYGHASVVEILCKAGANIHEDADCDWTPLPSATI